MKRYFANLLCLPVALLGVLAMAGEPALVRMATSSLEFTAGEVLAQTCRSAVPGANRGETPLLQ